jgi:molybdate transport system ATP-binding protein
MSIEARFKIRVGKFTLDADFSAPSRGITAVYGTSGSGKTTLLRAIAGLERAPTGRLKVGGVLWQESDHFIPPHKRSIGYVFQESSLFPHLNVKQNLQFAYRRRRHPQRIEFPEAVELLDLGQLLKRRPEALSGGERRRVAIARALLGSPKLLLLDEPMTGLDGARRRRLLPFIDRTHRELEIPIFYVSHHTDEVARLADHLLFMQDGHIKASGPINDMLTRFDLPLAHDEQAGAVLEATVKSFDSADLLTSLELDAGRLHLPGKLAALGQTLKLRIPTRDVSLTLTRQTGTSILNILRATVSEIDNEGAAQVLVKLDASGSPLLARITRRSARQLELTPGKTVFAQVKTAALL